jgi:putative flippase GtrA
MRQSGALTAQFIRFGLVGMIGFAIDTAVLYLCLYGLEFGFYSARIVSFVVAATATWALHRVYTFRGAADQRPHRQWARFLAANAAGGLVNYGTYAALILTGPPFTTHPVLAVIAGIIPALFLNFSLSRLVVFRVVKTSP